MHSEMYVVSHMVLPKVPMYSPSEAHSFKTSESSGTFAQTFLSIII